MHLRQKWTHSWKLESQKLLIVEDVTASDSGLLVCKYAKSLIQQRAPNTIKGTVPSLRERIIKNILMSGSYIADVKEKGISKSCFRHFSDDSSSEEEYDGGDDDHRSPFQLQRDFPLQQPSESAEEQLFTLPLGSIKEQWNRQAREKACRISLLPDDRNTPFSRQFIRINIKQAEEKWKSILTDTDAQKQSFYYQKLIEGKSRKLQYIQYKEWPLTRLPDMVAEVSHYMQGIATIVFKGLCVR